MPLPQPLNNNSTKTDIRVKHQLWWRAQKLSFQTQRFLLINSHTGRTEVEKKEMLIFFKQYMLNLCTADLHDCKDKEFAS